MMEMTRGKAPQALTVIKQDATAKYLAGGNFDWRTAWDAIIASLSEMTDGHCSFCDDSLFPKTGEKGEVEHFRPKSSHKELAYEWSNLFLCCGRCNMTKGVRFDEGLLKPDEPDYKFEDWFRYDLAEGILKPVKLGNPDWKRAETTIEIYGLNKEDKIKRRKYVWDEWMSGKDVHPFRFMRAADR